VWTTARTTLQPQAYELHLSINFNFGLDGTKQLDLIFVDQFSCDLDAIRQQTLHHSSIQIQQFNNGIRG
jgi:hypothetical protein